MYVASCRVYVFFCCVLTEIVQGHLSIVGHKAMWRARDIVDQLLVFTCMDANR